MGRPSSLRTLPARGERSPAAGTALRPPRALTAGALAGPVLIVSSLVQGVARDGFEFALHPPSALALGSAGAVQQATSWPRV